MGKYNTGVGRWDSRFGFTNYLYSWLFGLAGN